MADAPIATTLTLGLKKYKDGAKPGAPALNADKDTIDAAMIGSGTSFPAKYQVGKLFFCTDPASLGFFRNTGSQNSPAWTRAWGGSVTPAPNVSPIADALGKIDTAWLKDDVLLADGTRPLTGDLSAGGKRITDGGAPLSPTDFARLQDVQGLKRVEADVVAEMDTDYDIATELEEGDEVNGHTLVAGERVLLPFQTDGTENGLYLVPASGAASRTTDADTAVKLQNTYVIVADGTKWFGPSGAFTLGVDDVTFIEDPANAYTAGQNVAIAGNQISVTGLAVPEGGRAVRTTDQIPDSTVDGISTTVVALTTIKSNKNGVFDLGDDPTVYTVQQGGITTFSAWVRMKPGSSGSFVKLELVNKDTDEVIAESAPNDRVSNQKARYASVAGGDDFEAGTRIGLRVTTDAEDNGKIIEAAMLFGAAQGAGVVGTPEEGTDMADAMLLNSFYEEHGILPATVFHEALFTYPTPDFQNLGGGTFDPDDMATAKVTNASSSFGNFGWNLLSAKSKILFRCMIRMTAPGGNTSVGIFMNNSLPGGSVTDGYAFIMASNGRLSINKTPSFAELGYATEPTPPVAHSSQSVAVACYWDDATGRLVFLVRMGPEAPIKAVDVNDATYTDLQYVGFTWGGPGTPIFFVGSPQSIRHD